MRIFLDYIRFHKKTLLLFLLSASIFAVVFFLSRIPLDAVLYAALLALIAGAIIATCDFYHYVRHYRELEKLAESIDAQIDFLPEPRNRIDEVYTDMIKELHREKRVSEARSHVEKKEMIDYFTLWAHQIKTPISAMDLILQSKGAWAGEDDKRMAMELFQVEECVDTAMSYVRVRDLSSDLVFEEVSLDNLIRRAVKKYAAIFIGRKISVDFQETGRTVATDEKWMSIMLGQILANSLKYTPPGGRISIWMEGNKLMIRDTGIGIRTQDLPRVFEKGFTGENGRKYSKSTGQGLYICKTIADKLSYGLEITSREGEGTTVTLDLKQ